MSWTAHEQFTSGMPAPVNKWHHLRGAVLLSVLLLGFIGLGVRLIKVQVLEHDRFTKLASTQQAIRRPIQARRGGFYDRLGRPLCVSVRAKSAFLVPRQIDPRHAAEVAARVTGCLDAVEGRPAAARAEALRAEIVKRRDKAFMWVKRLVSAKEAGKLAALNYRFLSFRTEYRRTFPQGTVAPHVIGWTNVDQQGQEGLERVYDGKLRGSDGFEQLECDGRRRAMLTDRAKVKPVAHGCSIRLTLDTEIQKMTAEEMRACCVAHQPVSATAIVMEVETGRILALVNLPDYDPTRPAEGDPEGKRRMNHAVCSRYEPGSVFKPFVMSGYIEAGLGRIDDSLFCENGLFRYRGRRLHDHRQFDYLMVKEVLWKSSNIGMAKIGLAMGDRLMYETVTAFGFGSTTDSGLLGEVSGNVRPLAKWSYWTVTSVPMGHEVEVTPMQLITAFNAIANGGVLVKPEIVEAITDADGRTLEAFDGPQFSMRVLSEKTARLMVDPLLYGVVEQGTGKAARVGMYRKFGKTGTAQKVIDGVPTHSHFVVSFLCGAPVAQPKITVLVLVDDPQRGESYYASKVAAPVAARIVERTLRYLRVPAETMARGHDL